MKIRDNFQGTVKESSLGPMSDIIKEQSSNKSDSMTIKHASGEIYQVCEGDTERISKIDKILEILISPVYSTFYHLY